MAQKMGRCMERSKILLQPLPKIETQKGEAVMYEVSPLYRWLTYAGALPFLGCALLLALGIYTLPIIGLVQDILVSYGLIILAFMCGIHWGTYLYYAKQAPLNLFITSNFIIMSAWLASLMLPYFVVYGVLAIGFVSVLRIDKKLILNNLISPHYYQTRCRITAVVLISLFIAIFCSMK